MKSLKEIDLQLLIPLIPIIFFLMLTLQFWGQPPALDQMVIYRESTQFYNGGIKEIIENGVTIHPPLIYILNSISFFIFGKNPTSYNLIGLIIYLSNIFLLFLISKKTFGLKFAAPIVLILFCNPLVIVNAFYLSNDFLILSLIIWLIFFYLSKHYLICSLLLAISILMKETALVIVLSFTLSVFLNLYLIKQLTKQEIIKKLLIFLPAVFVFISWRLFLISLNTTEWRETFFINTQDSSFVIVIKKIISLNFFDIFLLQNLRNLFILNFQWFYLLIIGFLLFVTAQKKVVLSREQQFFIIFNIIIFLSYIFLVFIFPTWTVPRYTIPTLLPIFFCLSLLLTKASKILYSIVLSLAAAVILVSNITSLDPISYSFGSENIYNQTFYDIGFWNSGPDRIIYNVQFLNIVKRQNTIIADAIKNNADIIITYCDALKLGEKTYSVTIHNEFYPSLKITKNLDCINDYQVTELSILDRLKEKVVYLPKNEANRISYLLEENNIKVNIIKGEI